MGNYSVLTIDGVSLSYKYEIPAFLALLFADGDFYCDLPDDPQTAEGYERRVGYTTTAGIARERLEDAGFTYAFFGEIVETLTQDLDAACVELLFDRLIGEPWPVHDESDEEESDEEVFRARARACDLVARAATRPGREQIAGFAEQLKVDLASAPAPRYVQFSTDGSEQPAEAKVRRSIDISEISSGGLLGEDVDPGRPEVCVPALRVAQLFAEGSECPREVADVLLARVLAEVADAEAEVHLDLTDLYDGQDFAGEPSRLAAQLVRRVDLYNRAFSVLVENRDDVRRRAFFVEIERLLRDVPAAKTADEKGRVLEKLVASIFDGHPSFTISEKRVNLGDQEIDLVVRNHVEDPFWIALSTPLILVECKNWSSAVGTSELTVFRDKLRHHSRARLGIFVAMRGFSSEVDKLLVRSEAGPDHVLTLTGQNIRELVDEGLDVVEWLTRHLSTLI